MRRRIALLFVLAAAVAGLRAQQAVGTVSIVPRLGVSVATLSDMDVEHVNSGGKSSMLSPSGKAGVTAGIEAEYQWHRVLSLSLGAYYSMQGCRYSDFQTSAGKEESYYGFADYNVNVSYINVPLLVNAYVAKGLAVKAGVQVGFALSANEEYERTPFTMDDIGYREYESTTAYDSDIEMQSVDVAIPVGVSYEYMNVVLDARYNIGLTKVFKAGGDARNRCFTFTVGYRFEL